MTVEQNASMRTQRKLGQKTADYNHKTWFNIESNYKKYTTNPL